MQMEAVSIKCPPIIKKATVLIPFAHELGTPSRFLGCQPLHPALTVTVFRVFDVFARMKKGSTIEAPIYIACMRNIVAANDSQEPVILMHPHFSAMRPAALAILLLGGVLTQQGIDSLV